jgi:malonyl-CoA/methylmalonyl-CoA synthetase
MLVAPDGAVQSYEDVHRLGERLAGALRGAGAEPGDRVVVQLEKSPAAVACYLGCLRAGVVFAPLAPGAPSAEARRLVEDLRPALVVASPGAPVLSVGGAPCRTLAPDGTGSLLAPGTAEATPPARPGADAPAAILSTSGTTGRPKGAVISHGALGANAAALAETWSMDRSDVLLHVLPLDHVHGLFVALHGALAVGATILFHPRFDPQTAAAALTSCTVVMGVPTHYARLLTTGLVTPERCSGIRLFVSGSAPLPDSLAAAFARASGRPLHQRYGLTEALIVTAAPLGDPRPGTVGRPLPGVDLRVVVPETGQPCPPGAPGAVEVRTPGAFSGYWERPDASAAAWTLDGWLRTGDLGALDDEGWLRLVGRHVDMIITGGLNVYPAEVEAALDRLEVVAECAVVGLPDDDLGERVIAVVVPTPGAEPEPDGLRRALRRQLAGYKVPKEVHLVPTLPRNAMGKILKAQVRASLEPPG